MLESVAIIVDQTEDPMGPLFAMYVHVLIGATRIGDVPATSLVKVGVDRTLYQRISGNLFNMKAAGQCESMSVQVDFYCRRYMCQNQAAETIEQAQRYSDCKIQLRKSILGIQPLGPCLDFVDAEENAGL